MNCNGYFCIIYIKATPPPTIHLYCELDFQVIKYLLEPIYKSKPLIKDQKRHVQELLETWY